MPISDFCGLFPCSTCVFRRSCALRLDIIGWKKGSFLTKERVRKLAGRYSELKDECLRSRYDTKCVKAYNDGDYKALHEALLEATRL